MANFSITPGMGQGDILGAINYLLANIGQGLQTDLIRGIINVPNGTTEITNVYQLAYRYAEIGFADDQYGNGFDYLPEGKSYWGLRGIYLPPGSTYIGVPIGPGTRYNWYPIDPAYLPITADSSLYYNVIGPYQIGVDVYFAANSSAPDPGYREWFPGLTAQLIDTFNYSAPSTTAVVDTPLAVFPSDYQFAVGRQSDGSSDPYRPYDVSFLSDVEYTTSSTVANNLLTAPNINVNKVLTIAPQSSAPTNITTGSFAVADRVNWDPVSITTGTAYPVFYNGTTWTQLGGRLVHAMYQSTLTQTIAVSTASYRMSLDVVDFSYGITQNAGVITLDGPGIYDLQWSGQFQNSDNAAANAYIWLRQNGVDVPRSAGEVTIPSRRSGTNGATIAGWNYYIEATTASETVELWWGAENTSVTLPYLPPGTNPTRPATASLIVTIAKLTI
jgi:hypothetical protein